MSECMNKHICYVSAQHMSVGIVLSALCPPTSVTSSSSPALWSHSHSYWVLRCPLIAGWEGGWTRCSIFLSAACYCSCCCSAGRSRCVYLLCRPLLPVPLSLQYGSSVWEAAIPLFSRPLHLSVLLWVPAPLCPPHLVVGTGSKSLWYLAPRCPEQVMLTAFCLFSPWTELTTISAADRRHLVTACAAGLPSSAALKPNRRTQPQVFASVSLLPLLFCTMFPRTQLTDAFCRCTHLELLDGNYTWRVCSRGLQIL